MSSKLSPEHMALSARIQPLLERRDGAEGYKDSSAFETICAEDGRDLAVLNEFDRFRTFFAEAAFHAHGEVTRRDMEKDPEFKRSEVEFTLGDSHRLELLIERHASVPNRVKEGDGPPVIKGTRDIYGASQVNYRVHGVSGSKGTFKAIRDHVESTFTGAFGQK